MAAAAASASSSSSSTDAKQKKKRLPASKKPVVFTHKGSELAYREWIRDGKHTGSGTMYGRWMAFPKSLNKPVCYSHARWQTEEMFRRQFPAIKQAFVSTNWFTEGKTDVPFPPATKKMDICECEWCMKYETTRTEEEKELNPRTRLVYFSPSTAPAM